PTGGPTRSRGVRGSRSRTRRRERWRAPTTRSRAESATVPRRAARRAPNASPSGGSGTPSARRRCRGDRHRAWASPPHYLVDEYLVDHFHVGGPRLAAAAEREGVLLYGLKAPAIAIEGVSEGREVYGHRLQTPLEHQRARHAGIVLEVAREEPAIRREREPRAQVPPAPRATVGIEVGHLVEETHAAA